MTLNLIKCVCLVMTSLCAVAKAQGATPCTTPISSEAFSRAFSLKAPLAGEPYSATVVTAQDQIQPDGSIKHGEVTTHQARDASGQIWQEWSDECQQGADNISRPVLHRMIVNYRTGTTISWTEEDPAKMLRVVHFKPAMPKSSQLVVTVDKAAEKEALARMGVQFENLGFKQIAGVLAEGERTTQTLVTQTRGSKEPVRRVREIWTATKLDLELFHSEDDSKDGRRQVEVTELSLSEPDQTLFVVPSVYKSAESGPAN